MRNQFILTPFFLDQRVPGLESLNQINWHLNTAPLPDGDQQERMAILHVNLAHRVRKSLKMGKRPASIAGDCCTAIGVLAGIQQAGYDPQLIWCDAHGDFNTWETTPSGFLGGMPLAMLTGRGEQRLPEAVNLRSIPEKEVILTDARELDPAEAKALKASNIIHLPDITQLLNYPLSNRPLYIHFDTDIIDPNEAPAMNYPSPNGPSVRQLKQVFQHLNQCRSILAVSMSCWNPDLDKNGQTRKRSLELLNALLSGG